MRKRSAKAETELRPETSTDEDKVGQAMRLSILTCKTLNTATAATTPIRKCQYRIDNTKKKMVFRFNVQRQTRRLTMTSAFDTDEQRTTDEQQTTDKRNSGTEGLTGTRTIKTWRLALPRDC